MQSVRGQHHRPHGVRRQGPPWRVVAGVAAVAALAGCASVRQRGANLLGTPEEGGLLMVDGSLAATYDYEDREEGIYKQLQNGTFRFPQKDALDEIAIERTDDPGRYVYGTQFGGMVVFPRLKPGPYRLRSLGHRRFLLDHVKDVDYYVERRDFPFGGATGNVITFTIVQGSLGYVGGIDIEARYELFYDEDRGLAEFRATDQNWRARVEYNAGRERDAWTKLLQLSEGTAWAGAMLARLEELKSAPVYDPTATP
jgi:hypothetical protein